MFSAVDLECKGGRPRSISSALSGRAWWFSTARGEQYVAGWSKTSSTEASTRLFTRTPAPPARGVTPDVPTPHDNAEERRYHGVLHGRRWCVFVVLLRGCGPGAVEERGAPGVSGGAGVSGTPTGSSAAHRHRWSRCREGRRSSGQPGQSRTRAMRARTARSAVGRSARSASGDRRR